MSERQSRGVPLLLTILAGCSSEDSTVFDADTDLRSSMELIFGTDEPDIIDAGNGKHEIYGLGGDDIITGGNAKDVIHGGDGNDVIRGGNGKDVLIGGPGIDQMFGGKGDDIFIIANVCEVGAGETIDGGLGHDQLRTAVPLAQLEEMGVVITSIEEIVEIDEDTQECDMLPTEPIPQPPDWDGRLCEVLAQTASVVVGRVDAITQEFNEIPGEGPRTITHFADVQVLLGAPQPETLKLRQLGGPAFDDWVLTVTHQPRFEVGETYVAFLWNREWVLSPVPLEHYYRVDSIGGYPVLTDSEGYLLVDGKGGQAIVRAYQPATDHEPSALLSGYDADLAADASLTQQEYGTQLEAFAAGCPKGPGGVFNPHPREGWQEGPAVQP
jgi:hypothetical protein